MLDFLNTVLGPLEYVVSWILVEFHALFSLVFAPTSGWACSVRAACPARYAPAWRWSASRRWRRKNCVPHCFAPA